MLKINDIAKDFELPLTNGENFKLSSYRGKKNIVIYFYPKDDTPGCTLEAKDFNGSLEEFNKLETLVIGISKDAIKSHHKFKDKYCLGFELASDDGSHVCEDYGLWVEKSMYGKKYMGIERTTILIDKEGKIVKIWPKVKVENHVNEVLEEVKNLS